MDATRQEIVAGRAIVRRDQPEHVVRPTDLALGEHPPISKLGTRYIRLKNWAVDRPLLVVDEQRRPAVIQLAGDLVLHLCRATLK